MPLFRVEIYFIDFYCTSHMHTDPFGISKYIRCVPVLGPNQTHGDNLKNRISFFSVRFFWSRCCNNHFMHRQFFYYSVHVSFCHHIHIVPILNDYFAAIYFLFFLFIFMCFVFVFVFAYYCSRLFTHHAQWIERAVSQEFRLCVFFFFVSLSLKENPINGRECIVINMIWIVWNFKTLKKIYANKTIGMNSMHIRWIRFIDLEKKHHTLKLTYKR